MEHVRLKSDNNVLYKVSGRKNSKIEELLIFYLSFFLSFFAYNLCNSNFCG